MSTPTTKSSPPPDRARFFYTGAALLLFVLMFLGFQQFYLHGRAYPGRPLTPPIRTLVIAHGVAMTAWMLLFIVQPLLIANRKYKPHMVLGYFGAVLAVVIFILGLKLGIGSAKVNPPDLKLWNLNPKQFLMVPIVAILLYGSYVAIAV